jgi:N-acetylglucosaminyldiphosphoundecaprenol N-acetyl-beta-D-mannosaminyltransferase
MVMEAFDDPEFGRVVNGAALVTPDGMPLVWGLKRLGKSDVARVYGPTLTLHVCEAASGAELPIALYGGTEESLQAFKGFLQQRYPGIRVVCSIAPPFRPLTAEEDYAYSRDIACSGAAIVLVGIGCPKQEWWMARHAATIPAVLLGVGAAFDFHSGRVKQAPLFLQRAGLEWLFRLCMEPRRLWRRYFKHNPRFVYLFARQLLRRRFQLP